MISRFYILILVSLHSTICISQIRFSEDFSQATAISPPNGWQSILAQGVANKDGWRFDDPYSVSPLISPSSGKFATFAGFFFSDDDKHEEAQLITPEINLSGDGIISLIFYEYFYKDDLSGEAEVAISSDGGLTWTTIYEPSIESEEIPTRREFDISEIAAFGERVQIRFSAAGNGSIAWIIDDISIVAGPVTKPVIEHEPIASSCQSGQISIDATITSETGLSNVFLEYTFDGDSTTQTVVMTTSGDGRFSATINPTIAHGKLSYRIIAIDESVNNNGASKPESGMFQMFFGSLSPDQFEETFTSLDLGTIGAADSAIVWKIIDGASSDIGTSSISLNFYDAASGSKSNFFYTRPVEIESEEYVLLYKVAYAPYQDYYDTLVIHASVDNGATWSLIKQISGPQLATTSAKNAPFSPGEQDWKINFIDLSAYKGQCLQISFSGISGNGNNLYIDELKFSRVANEPIYASQNYPNPVTNGVTRIDLEIPNLRPFEFCLYSSMGTIVKRLRLEPQYGPFTINIDISDLPQGYYVYCVATTSFRLCKKMVVVK